MIDKRTAFDITDNKYNTIYNKLFEIALNNYAKILGFKDSNTLKSKYIIISKRVDNQLSAPNIILKSKTTPINIIENYTDENGTVITFKDFWPKYELSETPYNVINIEPAENFGKDELINIDYVRGIGRIYNKFTDIMYELPLKNIPKNIKLSKDITLSNTFLNLLNTK